MPAMPDRPKMGPIHSPTRLEALWAGDFGDDYVERNIGAERGRGEFWRGVLERLRPTTALEVGRNTGANLRWVAEAVGPENTAGVDVNRRALELVEQRIPGVDVRLARARELPFADASFELVFTMGVLIHQPPEELDAVMSEILRCSRRYVLCGEYFSEEAVEVAYRGERGALFKRDFGTDYERLSPKLKRLAAGFLSRDDGTWDDVTWWLFEKPAPATG
jgi:pseudaminic acid biosynthesis-associated methylase